MHQYLFLIVIAISAFNLDAADEGFRYRDGVCQNESGIHGYNPGFLGQCGMWEGADLSGKTFANLDLSGSNFRHANLSRTEFRATKLVGVILVESFLADVVANNVVLDQASLARSFVSGEWSDVSLRNGDLSSADLGGVQLVRVDLSKVNAEKASFRNSIATSLVAKGANFRGSNFEDVHWREIDFSGSYFVGSSFSRSKLFDLAAHDANFSDTVGVGVQWLNADLRSANLNRARLLDSFFKDLDLRSASLIGSKMGDRIDGMIQWQNATVSKASELTVPLEKVLLAGALVWRPQIVSGTEHVCSYNQHGLLYCFGWALNKRFESEATESPIPVLQSSRDPRAKVALGDSHGCYLSRSQVFCQGFAINGRLGTGEVFGAKTPQLVSEFPEKIVDLAAGGLHTCALGMSGKLYCFGSNLQGQLGKSHRGDQHKPELVSEWKGEGKSVCAGFFHTCVLDGSGSVYCMGANLNGQLGQETKTYRSHKPRRVIGLPDTVTQIRCGFKNTCAITDQGELYCFGANLMGQLGIGTKEDSFSPRRVPIAEKVKSVAVGNSHTCAIVKGGGAYCFGNGGSGQLGTSETETQVDPVRLENLPEPFSMVAAGRYHTCFLGESGRSYCTGFNNYGQLGTGDLISRQIPTLVKMPGFGKELAVIQPYR